MSVLIPLAPGAATDAITFVSHIFASRPHLQLMALRTGDREYTMVRRGSTPISHLFSHETPPMTVTEDEIHLLTLGHFVDNPQPNVPYARINPPPEAMGVYNGVHNGVYNGVPQGMMNENQLQNFINMTLHQNPLTTPLSTEKLNSLKSYRLKDGDVEVNEKCPICLDPLSSKISVVKLWCNHLHHEACVKRWFDTHDSCPLCRATSTISSTSPTEVVAGQPDEKTE